MGNEANHHDQRRMNSPLAKFSVGVVVSFAVLIAALAAHSEPWVKAKPMNGSVLAVAIIEESMEETRAQAVALPPDWVVIGCLLEGLDPYLHEAWEVLRKDPAFAYEATRWRDAYGEGLAYCARRDFGGANVGLMDAQRSLEILKTRSSR